MKASVPNEPDSTRSDDIRTTSTITTSAPFVIKGTRGKFIKPLVYTQMSRGLLLMANAKFLMRVENHLAVSSLI